MPTFVARRVVSRLHSPPTDHHHKYQNGFTPATPPPLKTICNEAKNNNDHCDVDFVRRQQYLTCQSLQPSEWIETMAYT